MKRSFALLALQFPPIGGGYSERMAGFSKFWCRENELDLHVICARPDGLDMPLDTAGEVDVSRVASITRLPTFTGWTKSGLVGKVKPLRLFWKVLAKLIPIDSQLPWSMAAARQAEQLYRRGEISAVVTSSTPYSVHVAGLRLKRRLPNLRWVADFRDPWTTNYQRRFRRWMPFSDMLHRRLEQAVYDNADAIIINTHQNVEDVDAQFRIDRKKFHVIQNGYDPELDFETPPALPRNPAEFRLGYIGGFRGDWFEGPLHIALADLKKMHPQAYLRLRVPLIGTNEVRGHLPTRLGVTDRFSPKGFVPRKELGAWVASLDGLVLILPDNEGRPLGWVPQRLYLYLATGLPILCIAPDGEAASYVRKTEQGTVVAPSETEKISQTIASWIASPPQRCVPYSIATQDFSKAVLAQKMLEIILPKNSEDTIAKSSTMRN